MPSYHKSRTRATTWVPRRVYYVLRHLQRQLTPGQAQAISNKQIQLGVKFGSEGEVSQIMRWLSGEAPTMGRWAYGCLNANAQTYRFITRERLPSGGYSVTLLVTPERIDAPSVRLPEIIQLSFFGGENDPSMIPHGGQQDAAQGGSFFHDPSASTDPEQPKAADSRSERDHPKETPKIQTQEKELACPLFERLMIQPGMSRALAQRIARSPLGTLADFEADLKLAEAFARSPFFFTVARWRDGQRVIAPEEASHVQPPPARSHRRNDAQRGRHTERSGTRGRPAGTGHVDPAVYAAILAEAIPLDCDDL